MNQIKKIYCRIFQKVFWIALPLLPYREPEILNAVEEIPPLLQQKRKRCVLLVTDHDIRTLGLTARLEQALAAHDIGCVVYDGTVPNPTSDNVEAARQRYLAGGCDALIAFGGGSSMDCAKAAGARIVKPHQPLAKMKGILKVHRKLPLLIAVPTTAGTGSETTLAAVITDSQTRHKYPINDFSLIPHYAVLDAALTQKLPKGITATTGMDALTHAVEAYIGGSTTRHTRAMAEEAVCLIHQYLYRAYCDGNDFEARQKMLRAAYCAGVAFTQSYVGYVHAIAHALGGQYGVPHGLANAVILPHMLDAYGAACYPRLGRLARKTGIADEQDPDAAQKMIAWIRQMNASMEIPTGIAGIDPADIPRMAVYADREGNPLYPVPKLMGRAELEAMFWKIRA